MREINWPRLTSMMQERDLDGVVAISPDTSSYLTGIYCATFHFSPLWLVHPVFTVALPDQQVFSVDTEKPVREENRPPWLKKVYPRRQHCLDLDYHIDMLVQIVRESGLDTARLGYESLGTPTYILQQLMTKLPKVTWVSSDVVFSQTMAEKTEWEIENQRQGVVMWERCFKRLMETLIEGETLNTLISRLAAFAVEEGAFLAWTHPSEAWGWWRSPPWLSRPDIVHRGSVIRRNMMISLDFGLHLEGYYIDMARQFVLGRASPEAKRRAAVSAAVQALVAEKLRPGISCRDGYREIRSAMAREFPGVDVLIHGVGLKINDTPMIIVEGNRNSEATHPDDLRFYPGTIFCIEPSIPEDMYLMHRNGPERLSALPLDVIEV